MNECYDEHIKLCCSISRTLCLRFCDTRYAICWLLYVCSAFDVTSSRHLHLAPGSIVAYPIMISVSVSAGSLKKHNAYWITCYNSRDSVLIVSDEVQRSCYYSLFCMYLRCSVQRELPVYHTVSTVKWKYGLDISGFGSCRGERIFCFRNLFKEALGGPSNKRRCQDGRILKLVTHFYIFPSCKLGGVIFQYFLEDLTVLYMVVFKPLIGVQYLENWEFFVRLLCIFSVAMTSHWLQRLSLKNCDIFWPVPEIRSKE